MNKSEVIKSIIEEQNTIIEDLKKAIKVYQNASDLDEQDTVDPEDLSHQTEYKDMQLRLEVKLQRKKVVVDKLSQFINKEISVVSEGSLVETDKMYIYVGAVAYPVTVNKKKAIGVSLNAPIVTTLKDKKVGDTINIGGVLNTIVEIG